VTAADLRFSALEARLGGFICALWGVHPKLQSMPLEGPYPPRRVNFGHGVIRVPEIFRGVARNAQSRVFHAALAHAGAHLRYNPTRFPPGGLKQLQVALVSLIEDARVEHLAMRDFPGLRRLFLPFHVAEPGHGALAPALFARLSRALIDPDYVDADAWVTKGRAIFLAAADEWHDPTISRRIGSLLGNDLGQMRVQFDAKAYIVEPAYRDDNLGLWVPSEAPPPAPDSETILETAKAEESKTEPRRGQDGEPANATRPAAPSEAAGIPIATYPEWDFLIRQPRPNWTTLRAYAPKPGRTADIDSLIAAHAPLGQKLTTAIRAARVSRPRRLRAQLEGDTLDLDACISAAISLRAAERPDPKIYSRMERRDRDLATLLLLDVSQSTNDRLPGSDTSVLALERAAAALLGDAMQNLGDRFAICAFCSNGRHDVRYAAIKDFADPFDDNSRRNLAGLSGALSTRLGAALRHAGAELAREVAYRRLLLVVSDGEPSDIDVGDRRYLVEDAGHAVRELFARGIDVFCVGLNAGGRDVTRIFGRHRTLQLDRIEKLPETLPLIYLRVTA
jgi:Mg-chelatase subunit ChlD